MLRFRQRGVMNPAPFEGLSPEVSQLLRNRGVDTQEKAEKFLHPSLSDLYDPYLMQDMDRAVELIRKAVREGVGIQIYGDYDTDGVTSTSIMLYVFEKLGVKADFRIPSRHSEGYGLNEQAVREIAKHHGLLITVDCGITNHEEVQLAKDLGMTVIVTDHHQLPETPVPADAILNPLCGSYPFRRLCGAGVALKVCQALLGMDGVVACLDLAALATVADIVPLIDENRIIVTYGMQQMAEGRRIGLQAMIEKAECTFPMTSSQLAFRLAPRINAGGRLEDADQCVNLLTGTEPAVVQAIAQHLEENNRARQTMQTEITRRATELMWQNTDFYDDRCIVVMGDNWNTGVIGLAAGKLCEIYHYPTIVLSRLGDKAVGSCRSVPGVNIHQMLSMCSDLFQRFGGHELAAGLTMDPNLVDELRRRLNLLIREHCDASCLIPVAEYDMPLRLQKADLDLIDQLDCMQPTGFGNPSPLFLTLDCHVQQASAVGKDGAHLKLALLEGDTMRDGIAFSKGEMASHQLERVDILYEPTRNTFRGLTKPQVQVSQIRGAQGAAAVPGSGRIFPHLLQELKALASNDSTIPLGAGNEGVIRPIPRSQLKGKDRGLLLIGHSQLQAKAMASEVEVDITLGRVPDPRGFNTLLLCPDFSELRDVWQTIVLIDDDVLPGEADAIRAACPRAQIFALKLGRDPKTNPLLQELRDLQMDTDALRSLYVALRPGGQIDGRAIMHKTQLSAGQLLLGLETFAQIRLLTWTLNPLTVTFLPPRKASPDESPILRYVRSLV